MCASACLMLALLHLMLWLKTHRRSVYLMSTIMAVGAASCAVTELLLMTTESVSRYGALLQLENLAVYLLLIPMVWFVYLFFGTARRWLAITITVMWSAAIVVNFLSPASLVFSEITGLMRLSTFWGESFTVAVGSANPWVYLPNAASALILLYLIDASIGAWRRGNHHRAILVGGGTVFFVVIGGVHAPLVDAGLIQTPYMVSFAFLAIVLTMSYELVNDAILSIRYAREIEASNRRWNSLLEKVPLLVAGVDREGCIDYVNSSFLQVSGYTQEELCGRHLTDLLPERARVDAMKAYSEAMQGRLLAHAESVLQTKSGDRRQVRWSNVLLTDGEGSPTGVLSIGSDITEQLAAQSELQRTRQEMEHLARVTMLGELVASLAHELNQPLAAILSNAQAARRFLAAGSPDLVELAEILDDIVRDDKRAGEVIHRLRFMLGKGESTAEALEISDTTEEVVNLLSGEIKAEGIVLRIDLGLDLPIVHAGRIEIQQVLMNLILNAMHAMKDSPKQSRELTVRSRVENGSVLVSVVDNGDGIEVGVLPTLFDAFVTTKSNGMGMGLAISRRIVEAHGGRIWAETNTAGGATFSFTLPIERHETISASA